MKTYSKSELFTMANNLRKSQNISQKEAFAMAKKMLETKNTVSLHEELVQKMNKGNVKFTFINKNGKQITTTGTSVSRMNVKSKRVIQGRKEPKSDEYYVFYDVRHGVYRSYKKTNVVKIFG